MKGKLAVFLFLTAIIVAAGCVQQPEMKSQEKPLENNTSPIYSNANRLFGDYKWKLDLVTEIQQRTDALGKEATKEMYIEWERRNNEAIDAGERLATYITEHRDALDYYWTSDVLVLIAKNKVTFERDNQALEQMIKSLEQPQKLYKWQIDYYGREGSRDLGILTFINSGKTLPNVKFRFEFYKSSGDLYSEDSVPIGDVSDGKIVQKKVSLPGRYTGEETWSQEKIFVYVNGSVKEIMVYENDIWKEEQINNTGKII
jgi:hypothetical protein